MTYTVTAPLVIATDETGARHHLYEGMPLPGSISKDEAQRLVDAGLVSDGKPETPADEKPAGNASQEKWAEYAVKTQGVSEDEVKDLSRDELRELYG